MKISPRSQKLAGEIERKLPAVIQLFATPNQVGFLTISAVEVSGDLGVADIFVRSIGPIEKATEYLNKISDKLGYELLQKLPMRRQIKLRFKKDKSVDAVKVFDNLPDEA